MSLESVWMKVVKKTKLGYTRDKIEASLSALCAFTIHDTLQLDLSVAYNVKILHDKCYL